MAEVHTMIETEIEKSNKELEHLQDVSRDLKAEEKNIPYASYQKEEADIKRFREKEEAKKNTLIRLRNMLQNESDSQVRQAILDEIDAMESGEQSIIPEELKQEIRKYIQDDKEQEETKEDEYTKDLENVNEELSNKRELLRKAQEDMQASLNRMLEVYDSEQKRFDDGEWVKTDDPNSFDKFVEEYLTKMRAEDAIYQEQKAIVEKAQREVRRLENERRKIKRLQAAEAEKTVRVAKARELNMSYEDYSRIVETVSKKSVYRAVLEKQGLGEILHKRGGRTKAERQAIEEAREEIITRLVEEQRKSETQINIKETIDILYGTELSVKKVSEPREVKMSEEDINNAKKNASVGPKKLTTDPNYTPNYIPGPAPTDVPRLTAGQPILALPPAQQVLALPPAKTFTAADYQMTQEAFDDYIAQGFEPGTEDFDAAVILDGTGVVPRKVTMPEPQKTKKLEEKPRQYTAADYQMTQEAFDDYIAQGFEPGTEDFDSAVILDGTGIIPRKATNPEQPVPTKEVERPRQYTAADYQMTQEAFDDYIAQGFEPGTEDFDSAVILDGTGVVPSKTATPVITPTQTPVVTPRIKSPAITPVSIPRVTPVVTPRVTPIVIPRVIPVVTPVVTPTKTPVVTPVVTPTKTPVVTPVVTPTKTPVVTPVVTPTKTPVVTPVVTPTKTPVVTPVVTPTKTPVVTPVVTPTKTPVVTPVVTPTKTPVVTPVVTPTKTPVVTPTPKKQSTNLYRVIQKITKGVEVKAKDGNAYRASNIKVAESFKNELRSGNYLYNIVHFAPAIIKAPIQFLIKLSGKLRFGKKSKKRIETMKQNIEKLTEEEIMILYKEYRAGRVIQENFPTIINILIEEKIQQFVLGKVTKLNQYLESDYNYIFSALKTIEETDKQLRNPKLTPAEKTKLLASRKRIVSGAAQVVSRIRTNYDEAQNWLSGGLQGFSQDMKAAATKLSVVGKRFAKKHDLDHELLERQAQLKDAENKAIEDGNDEMALRIFVESEKLLSEETSIDGSIFGKRSTGKKYYSPLAEKLDYRDDPFIRDLFTTAALASAAYNIVNTIKGQDLSGAQAQIDAANQQLAEAQKLVDTIKGKQGTFKEGMEAQAIQGTTSITGQVERGALDSTNWGLGTSAYRTADNAGHSFYNQVFSDTQTEIGNISSQYASGAITQAEALELMRDLANGTQSTLSNVSTQCLQVFTDYAKTHPQFDLRAVTEAVEYITQHPDAISQMNNAVVDISNMAEGLTFTQIQALQSVPGDMLVPLFGAASVAALTNNVAQTMDENVRRGKYGNSVTKMVDEYAQQHPSTKDNNQRSI